MSDISLNLALFEIALYLESTREFEIYQRNKQMSYIRKYDLELIFN